jgi:MFS family permease
MALAMPTRASMTPNLVPPELLAPAAAMNQVMWNTAGVVGPALGGIVVGTVGLAWAYGIDLATYLVAIGFTLFIHAQRPKGKIAADDKGWAAVVNGMRFLRGKRVLQSTFTIDIVAMVFDARRTVPVLADQQFHRGPEAVGWMFSAVALAR